MKRPLSSLRLEIAAVILLGEIGGLAVGQDRGARGERWPAPQRGAAAAVAADWPGPALTLGPARRRRLSRPTTPSKAPDPMGFIQRWMVLEPIPASGLTDSAVRAAVGKEYFPDQLTVLPHDGDKVSVNGQDLVWHAEETSRYNLNLFHFARQLRKPSGNALFWVVSVVNCPDEVKDARLAVGSNAASVWWVNGKEVVALYGDRQTVIDDGVSRRLTLGKGPNVVRGAVINGFRRNRLLAQVPRRARHAAKRDHDHP